MTTPTIDNALVGQLRRMTGEMGSLAYTDAQLWNYITAYPVNDAYALVPVNPLWTPTYSLNDAAADIWLEKMSMTATYVDFTGEGATLHASQIHDNAEAMYRLYNAKRVAKTHRIGDPLTVNRQILIDNGQAGFGDVFINLGNDDPDLP